MQLNNWKIFDKKGSPLNWTPDPWIQLVFNSTTGKGAEGYLVTDPSGRAVYAEITNGGYLYDDAITASYTYAFSPDTIPLSPADASILTKDVSIFDPDGKNTKSISGLTLDLSTNFVYPSVTFASAIFLEPISVGLVETEHLFILEELDLSTLIRPYDASNSTLVVRMVGSENEIKFFEVDETDVEITWTDELVFDLSTLHTDVPLTINVGFRAETEGVFERTMRFYHKVGDTLYTLADIVVNAEAVGEDERFRDLIANFGLPDPKDMKDVFKETDINEDLPDWEILNYKSKHMILEHDKIMPFVGAYKGLINAVKWLGYDDVYFREWFKNVKENKKLSFIVPYDAADRTQTILMFNADQRKVLKKLNQLSMVYCLTRETGQIDDWGTPMSENCYEYNLKEVFIKLMGLKKWLEQNIIGVNCRIVDITGEGIYLERVQNKVYTTDTIGYTYSVQQSLTPYGVDGNSELITGDASVRLSFLELTQSKVENMPLRFKDLISYAWNPNDPSTYYSVDDPSYLADPSSFLLVGSCFQYPFLFINDIMYRLSVEKDFSGILGETLVTNPLHILENDIRYVNMFDSSSVFYDVSTNLTIYLEKAYLRDPSMSDEWTNSIAYSIYPNASANGYVIEASSGSMIFFDEYIAVNPDTGSLLQYAVDDNYKVPLLSFKNYRTMDASGVNTLFDRLYYLDILDGKIEMNAGIMNPTNSSDNATIYLNFNYDTSLDEQMITVNVIYDSPRMTLFQFDPSTYYWADPSGLTGGNDPSVYLNDNSIYTMHVNHIGEYNIEMFAWDDFNTMFYNPARKKYPVWIKAPTLYTLIDNCCNTICVSTYMSMDDVSALISNNKYPIFDRNIPLQGVTLGIDTEGKPYISVPSITYWQDVPEPNSINRVYNLTERVTSIAGLTITIDDDYQKFYTGDDVRLVRFDKGKYALIEEVSSRIVTASGSEPVSATLDQIPGSFVIEASTDIYILNDTYRATENAANVGNYLELDVSGYAFEVGQLVGIIVTDASKPGMEWGSSFRVTNVDGSTHTFEYSIPDFFVNNPKYEIKVKHAYSSYADLTMITESATEVANTFKIYNKDSYCQEYYLDNTFVLVNLLFDQDVVNRQWYDASDNLVNDTFYYHPEPIVVDISTLVILRAMYDPSTYLLNQRNIWQVVNHDSSLILFKVWNESVPYIFNEIGTYDVECTSYDSFGNAIIKKYEGLIEVI